MVSENRIYCDMLKKFENVARNKDSTLDSFDVMKILGQYVFLSKRGYKAVKIEHYDPIFNKIKICNLDGAEKKELSIFKFWSLYLLTQEVIR